MNQESDASNKAFPGSSIHPVEDLQKKGIRQLRVIPESQLKKAAREAVARALLEVLESLDVSEEVRQELKVRATKIIHGQSSGATISSAPVEAVGSDPANQRTNRTDTPPLVVPSIQDQVSDIPNQVPAPVPNPPGSPLGQREKALLLQLSRLIAQDWRSELATVRDSHRDQVERLEMRILELTQALHTTDQVLDEKVSNDRAEAGQQNPFDSTKTELLDQLFQANVALRALSERPSKGVSPTQDGEGR
ncbi:MAG: hypothetical protein AAEJ04_08500 [Planctomycetota bacterium]